MQHAMNDEKRSELALSRSQRVKPVRDSKVNRSVGNTKVARNPISREFVDHVCPCVQLPASVVNFESSYVPVV